MTGADYTANDFARDKIHKVNDLALVFVIFEHVEIVEFEMEDEEERKAEGEDV